MGLEPGGRPVRWRGICDWLSIMLLASGLIICNYSISLMMASSISLKMLVTSRLVIMTVSLTFFMKSSY